MWGPVEHAENERKAQQELRRCQLAAKWQRRWREWQHVANVEDQGFANSARKSINTVSQFVK